ncbi:MULTISPECIES: C40 family peptidase [Streptomyces]|uniref:C40 family peptidase n=1 Tax=Streptomyces TaxID=1883 RepID=UPI002FCC51AC
MTAPLRSGLLTRTVLPTGDLRILQLPNREGLYIRKTRRALSVAGPKISGWQKNRRRTNPRFSPPPYAHTCPRPASPSPAGPAHKRCAGPPPVSAPRTPTAAARTDPAGASATTATAPRVADARPPPPSGSTAAAWSSTPTGPTPSSPRTAAAQYQATAHRPVSHGELRPGDLLFWAHRNGSIYHVGLYAGSGRVLHAPRTGRQVEVVALDSAMPASDYRGATRA